MIRFIAISTFAICLGACVSPGRGALDAKIDKLLITPDLNGHRDFIDAIEKSKRSVHLAIYHLTDPGIVDALVLVRSRGIDVKVIMDNQSLRDEKFMRSFKALLSREVPVRASSPAFSIMHQKSMVIDGEQTFITAINLTQKYDQTRDFGISTHDPRVALEVESVFETDWENAATGQARTPNLTMSQLVWSPVQSRKKLVGLINSARISILSQVENLGDADIAEAMREAVHRGVDVRLLIPMCDRNPNPLYNFPFVKKLIGVNVRAMPDPSTREVPYMHSKMILVDRSTAYVGSVNFSNNSTQRARELGIIFNDADASKRIADEFEKDWRVSVPAIEPAPGNCQQD